MAVVELANGHKISISPIFDKSFELIKVVLKESAFGDLPDITLTIRCDEDIVQVLDEVKGSLINPDGFAINFVGYVYSLDFANYISTIKILAVDKKFTRESNINKWTSVPNAIKSLYPGKIISNTDSDLLNSIDIYQKNISDYNLCNKLAWSYKKDTVFGFALGSLRFHDLNNWSSKYKMVVNIETGLVTPPELTQPKLYDKVTKFIDYSKGQDPNHSYIKFHNNILMANNDQRDLIGNYLYNKTKFDVLRNSGNYEVRTVLPIQVTDGVELVSKDNVIKKTFVSNIVINLDYNEVKVGYTLKSKDPL